MHSGVRALVCYSIGESCDSVSVPLLLGLVIPSKSDVGGII